MILGVRACIPYSPLRHEHDRLTERRNLGGGQAALSNKRGIPPLALNCVIQQTGMAMVPVAPGVTVLAPITTTGILRSEGGGSGRSIADDIRAVRDKARHYHKLLGQIAGNSRTTIVPRLLTTKNQIIDLIATTDKLEVSYRTEAAKQGDRVAPVTGEHAEKAAFAYLEQAKRAFEGTEDLKDAVPLALGVYGESTGPKGEIIEEIIEDARPICAACQSFLTDRAHYGGATITEDARVAYWPWYYSP